MFLYTCRQIKFTEICQIFAFKRKKKRFEIKRRHKFYKGINEEMSIDKSVHSLFGVSKTSGDLLTQEFGKNFKIKTGIFRLGCITGENHAGAELHGF